MIEIKLPITDETTLDDLRAFVRVTEGVDGGAPIISINMHDEMDATPQSSTPRS